MADAQPKRETWGSRLGVILAVTGSAVGLGNFLRFPGLAAQYEGGAFMIPYFIALLLIGLPLAWAEWAMGRYGGVRGFNSTPGIYRTIWPHKAAPYIGVTGILIPVGIFMYYVVIEAWCLAYAWYYLTGKMAQLGAAATTPTGLNRDLYVALFTQFTGATHDGAIFTRAGLPTLLFVSLCFALNYAIIYRGLSKGIEKFCIWAMPALIVCALLVLLRVLTLPHISAGLGFMWNPRTRNIGFFQSLANPRMWLDATAQIFFTLSVGFGIIITYASYLKQDDDIALSSLTSCAGNEFCEVGLGGLITIPAAFLFLGATQVTQVSGSSFNLGFNTLPMVFQSMPLGQAAGFAFFFLLFLAALTSSLSMLQPAIALLEEGLGLNRKASVSLLGFITLIGALFVLYFSKGTLALATFDFWTGTFLIFVLALFQTVLFGWVLGIQRGLAEIDRGAEIRIPRIVGFILKYISPFYLAIIFFMWLWQQIQTPGDDNMFLAIGRQPAVTLSVGFLILVTILFSLLVTQSVKRWERAHDRPEHSPIPETPQ
ncbi:MAG TPA: sodium-dependent transporter [Tepidisphaeraceae bacterium]|nr:sodium-dependent transporter [Tepidisphaeraceae bacterium]